MRNELFLRVFAMRRGRITRNDPMGYAGTRVRCDGDFRLTPGHAAARLCTRCAKWRERGSRPAHVTEDRPYMSRLSHVKGDHP